MNSVIKKRGKNTYVQIPAAVLQTAHLKLDDPVDVREESGRIVIESLQSKKFDLAALLKGITRKNLHDNADLGTPVGKELPRSLEGNAKARGAADS